MAYDVLVNIFDHTLLFIILTMGVFSVVGWFTGHFSVGMFGGFLTFVNIVVEQNITILTNIMYISMVGILIFTAFRLYNFSINGGGVES